jgi:hypothetical protein
MIPNASVLLLSATLAVAGLLGCSGSKSSPTDPGAGDEAGPSGANDAIVGDRENDRGAPIVADPDDSEVSDPDQTTTPVVNPEFGIDSIVDRLLSLDMEVERTGEETGHSYLTPTGELLRLNGQDVQAYTYESAEAAKKEAVLINPDGSKEGVAFIRWPGPMHFYGLDRYILVYVGEDEEVLISLNLTFGGAFAGEGQINYEPEPKPLDPPGSSTDGGTSTGYDLPAAVFFATSEEDLDRLLSTAGADPRLADELANLNFESSWVLVFFRGVMPSAGYDVTIEMIRQLDSTVEVVVSLGNPGPTELVADVITYPFDVLVIARSDIPEPSLLDWVVVDENGDVLTKLGRGGDGPDPEPGVVIDDPGDMDPGLEPEPLPPADIVEKIDIRGTISSAELVEDEDGRTAVRILVEGEVEADTNVDRALVSITPLTIILEAADGDDQELTSRDLEAGMTVEIRFAGPVMKSYPVQASAEYVIILR